MQVNEGTLDRALRIALGVVLVAAAFVGALGPWAWVGVVPLVTGFLGMCPLYRLLGIDTCSTIHR